MPFKIPLLAKCFELYDTYLIQSLSNSSYFTRNSVQLESTRVINLFCVGSEEICFQFLKLLGKYLVNVMY